MVIEVTHICDGCPFIRSESLRRKPYKWPFRAILLSGELALKEDVLLQEVREKIQREATPR